MFCAAAAADKRVCSLIDSVTHATALYVQIKSKDAELAKRDAQIKEKDAEISRLSARLKQFEHVAAMMSAVAQPADAATSGSSKKRPRLGMP
jgi:uncharacterized protein (DUF3084 family)